MGDYQFKFPNQQPISNGPPPGGSPAAPGTRPGREFMGGPVADGGPEPAPTRIPGGGPTTMYPQPAEGPKPGSGNTPPGFYDPSNPPQPRDLGGGPVGERPAPPTMPPVRNPMPPVRNPMPPVGANSMTAASNQARKVQAPRIPPMSGGDNDWYGKNAPQGKPFTPPPSAGLNPRAPKKYPYR